MKAIITLLLISGVSGAALGQGSVTLSAANSNVKFSVSNNGTFFHNPIPTGTPGGYIVPKDSAVSSIYAMSFMAVGEDVNGLLKGAVAQYMTSDFKPGPFLMNFANYSSQSYLDKYQSSLWDITKVQIDNHIAHWMDAGYVVPAVIADWPGNGNTGNGESSLLAPFHDVDGDQIYEPQNGDYPLIRGDKAVYTIINDGNGIHPSGTDPIGLEIHMMFYQYEDPSDDNLTNAVFFQTTLFNRGTQTLNHFHAGHLIDFDLGNPHDDYLGSLPSTNLVYVYNGTSNDPDFSGNPGFGAMPPAAGIINLDGALNSHIPLTNPTSLNNAAAYYNVLKGLLPDGSPLINQYNQPTTFLYDGLSPYDTWNELDQGNVPGDRRSVIGLDEANFGPGRSLCYNHAAIFARKSGSITASVDSLFQVANHIQDFYDNQNFYCESQFLGLQEDQKLSVSIYPNPVKEQIHIEGLTAGTYRIINAEGKEILVGNFENPIIQTDSLKNGFYILEITSGGKYDRKSFIKE
ncbi:MAG: T9SS type A sorting domain-containing protein [Fluviicola sp.]